MAFSERVRHLAKSRAAFRCCVCHKPFVEIHHLIPKSEGGLDTLENAAPLCASCHDLYGGNPEKRRVLTQMRNHWWDLMREREKKLADLSESASFEVAENIHFQGDLHRSRVVIYHRIFPEENFKESAITLMNLVRSAQESNPNNRRLLFLDIEGHRNKKGGFDREMRELQVNFLGQFVMQYLGELHMPLMNLRNRRRQDNDVPTGLRIFDNLNQAAINEAIEEGIDGIWLGENSTLLRLPKGKGGAGSTIRESRRRNRRKNRSGVP